MSNETKRDVLVDAVDTLADAQASGGNIGHQDADLFMAEYEKALPDDLPVIPKAVSEYIKFRKKHDLNITDSLTGMPLQVIYDTESIGDDIFTRAWLLGVWKVAETGEIVKLEAEK